MSGPKAESENFGPQGRPLAALRATFKHNNFSPKGLAESSSTALLTRAVDGLAFKKEDYRR
jgi:hypothetical protein